jgi:Beta2-adaptin appendage, C-terminal sub-domain
MHVFFVEDGLMEKGVFLATWKDIASDNEKQFEIHTSLTDAGLACLFSSFLNDCIFK